METIDETAIINQAPLPNQGIPEHESFTPSTDDCRRDTVIPPSRRRQQDCFPHAWSVYPYRALARSSLSIALPRVSWDLSAKLYRGWSTRQRHCPERPARGRRWSASRDSRAGARRRFAPLLPNLLAPICQLASAPTLWSPW